MRRRAKVDLTHPAIVEALLSVGASVQSLAPIGHGCPDLLVSFRMRWYVIEAKSAGGTLTPDELDWIQDARAEVAVCYTAEQALAAIGAIGAHHQGRSERC